VFAGRSPATSRLRYVVASARALFIERGFASTTVADVAPAAGVSTQFVYAAFSSTRGLLGKVVD
jgi:AcrR family transcriptional regulator